MQLDWRNYMLPVDGRFAVASDVPAHAVDVQSVLDAFRAAGNRMNIVVLDACRDNPYGASASAKGLAPMDAPSGTFLAYATAPGNVAEDGSAATGNGLYTQYLVQELKVPGDPDRRRLQARAPSGCAAAARDDRFPGKAPASRRTSISIPAARWRPCPTRFAKPSSSTRRRPGSASKKKLPRRRRLLRLSPTLSQRHDQREGAVPGLEQLQKSALAAQPGIDGVASVASSGVRYRAGDRLVYRTFDGYNKEQGLRELLITEASDARVVVNGGRRCGTRWATWSPTAKARASRRRSCFPPTWP